MAANNPPGVPTRCYTCGHRIVVMRARLFGKIVHIGHDPNCQEVGPDGRPREGNDGGKEAAGPSA